MHKRAEKKGCAKQHPMRLAKRANDFLSQAFIELRALQHFHGESDINP